MASQSKIPRVWSKNDHAGRQAWKMVSALTQTDKNLMGALAGRMRAVAGLQAGGALWEAEAEATAPFTTGLGNEHPLENGFSFLNPYGLPYLPGSGVKGVVREAARQLAAGEWEDSRGWDLEPVGQFTVRAEGEEKEIKLTALDVLFGRETPEGESDHFRGVLSFWDVIPEMAGKALRVEVMTPHQTPYYQQKTDKKSGDSTTPHDSGQPNPILFLTVPPGSKFHFFVTCDLVRLKRVAPSLAEGDRWKQLLDAAFAHAFDWLGFGAKTGVGYGAMRRKTRPAGVSSGERKESSGVQKSPAGAEEKLEIWENAMLKWNPGKQEITAICSGKPKAILDQGPAKAFLESLSQEQREQLKNKKSLGPVRLRVKAEGNKWTVLGLA
ncbi:MAG: type III-B CRISPR module RAMP protein Cmr6 [Bryobacteraceae bacterium]